MKFIDRFGVLGRARANAARPSYVQQEDVTDPGKLVDLIRKLQARVAALEARTPPDAVEFERDVTDSVDVEFAHGFQGPVRWFVTSWIGSGPPTFSSLPSPQPGVLKLQCGETGLVVLRIEPSQYGTQDTL